MPLTPGEIIEYAGAYVERHEMVPFVQTGELFCFVERDVDPEGKLKDEEGWSFAGYGVAAGYELDPESKPEGKWILFGYYTLNSFPPQMHTLRLQPPHIVKGMFYNAERTVQIRIIALPQYLPHAQKPKKSPAKRSRRTRASADAGTTPPATGRILKFPPTQQ